jgi:hypothetical protein
MADLPGCTSTLARPGKRNAIRESHLRGNAEMGNIAVTRVTIDGGRMQVIYLPAIALHHNRGRDEVWGWPVGVMAHTVPACVISLIRALPR